MGLSYPRNFQPSILFSTPLWHYNSKLPKGAYEWALNYKETHPMKDRKVNSILYKGRSGVGGYQSPQRPVEEFPYMDHLWTILNPEFDQFKAIGWWLNINPKGSYNKTHTHPGCDLAAIWYITDNYGLLNFIDSSMHERYAAYVHVMSKHNETSAKKINAGEGDLLVFPADLPHGVEEHQLDTPRISVSFNMVVDYKEKW